MSAYVFWYLLFLKFQFLTIRGNTSKTPPRGTWTWAAWEDAPPAALSLVLLSRQPHRCRSGVAWGIFSSENLHIRLAAAPPARQYEPVFAVEVKGSLAPGAPMQWSLWSNNPTICQEQKTFCHALLLMKNQTLSWEVTTLAFAFFGKTMLYVQHQDRRTALCSKFVQISQI